MSLRPLRLQAIAAVLALVCLPTFGCSWLFVNKPPSGPLEPTPPVECTSTDVAPILDTVPAALLGGLGLFGVVGGALTNDAMAMGYGAILVVPAVPYALSAVYGYSKTAECRHLNEAQLSCISGVEEACRTLKEQK